MLMRAGRVRRARQDQLALDTHAGARQFQQLLAAKSREVHRVLADAAADRESKAALRRSSTGACPTGEDNAVRLMSLSGLLRPSTGDE